MESLLFQTLKKQLTKFILSLNQKLKLHWQVFVTNKNNKNNKFPPQNNKLAARTIKLSFLFQSVQVDEAAAGEHQPGVADRLQHRRVLQLPVHHRRLLPPRLEERGLGLVRCRLICVRKQLWNRVWVPFVLNRSSA